MGQIESWAPMWAALTERWSVTAMDRRGRASSGDGDHYSLSDEYADVASVAAALAARNDGMVGVFAHSYGAVCAIGAAHIGAPFRRVALYEPPGPETVSIEWANRVCTMIADEQIGRAMVTFLNEIIGYTADEIEALKSAPRTYDVLRTVQATMPREATALATVDLAELASSIAVPVMMLLGSNSQPWAKVITDELLSTIKTSQLNVLPGCRHDAIDTAPQSVVDALSEFLGT